MAKLRFATFLAPRAASGPAPAAEKSGGSRRNCFNTLRLGAAVAVLVSHSFALAGRHEPSIGPETIGRVAVLVFFAISGFLITQSWRREPHLGRYLLKRGLRILPALIGVLVLTALVLGPVVTTRPAGSYLDSWETWSYILHNTAFRMVYELPGVFVTNPYPRLVNASLWTLPVELRAYLMVAALGLLGMLGARALATMAFIAVYVAPALAPHLASTLMGEPHLTRAFVVGALLYLWQDRLPWRAWIAVPLVAIWVLRANSGAGPTLAVIAVAYTTILVAHHGPAALQRLTRRRDISYGIYLWAFPVQQTTALVWKDITPLELMAVALPIASLLAMASWTLIEQPALRLKSLGQRRSATAERTPAPVVVTRS